MASTVPIYKSKEYTIFLTRHRIQLLSNSTVTNLIQYIIFFARNQDFSAKNLQISHQYTSYFKNTTVSRIFHPKNRHKYLVLHSILMRPNPFPFYRHKKGNFISDTLCRKYWQLKLKDYLYFDSIDINNQICQTHAIFLD